MVVSDITTRRSPIPLILSRPSGLKIEVSILLVFNLNLITNRPPKFINQPVEYRSKLADVHYAINGSVDTPRVVIDE